MNKEQLTPEQAAESILDRIFTEREHNPDVFDAAGIIAGAVYNILGYREAYFKLKSQVESQRAEGRLSSPQLTLMRYIEGLDRLNELETILKQNA